MQLFQSISHQSSQNGLEWPISPNLQLIQSFPIKVANDIGQCCPIINFSKLFPLKWLGSQFHLICNFSNLFPSKWLRMTWNGQFHLIRNFSNLFPSKWLGTANFARFTTFPNLFPPKWLRMTWNGQFHPICNFSNLFPLK